MKNIFVLLSFFFVCNINAQTMALITAEQPILGYSDTTQTLVSVEISEFQRNGVIFTPFEGRLSKRHNLLKFGKIGVCLTTDFNESNFRIGSGLNLCLAGIRNYQNGWEYAPTADLYAYMSYDFINDGYNRLGIKVTTEIQNNFMVALPFGVDFNIRAGLYYAFELSKLRPEILCPTF